MIIDTPIAAQSFLSAILENPAADEPRLSYADILDQNCDPRGEFIRVQCRLARGEDSGPCLWELETRERELLEEFEWLWAEPIARYVDGWVFQRGFVEEIMVSVRHFVQHAEDLLRITPLQEVHFSAAEETMPDLAPSPALTQLRFLDFSDNRLGDNGIQVLSQSEHLAGIQGLNLTCTALGDAGAIALARARRLMTLRELYLSSNRIGDEGACALARSCFLQRLKVLFLDGNRFSASARAILRQCFGSRVQF